MLSPFSPAPVKRSGGTSPISQSSQSWLIVNQAINRKVYDESLRLIDWFCTFPGKLPYGYNSRVNAERDSTSRDRTVSWDFFLFMVSGGTFMASGSVDSFVRVYNLMCGDSVAHPSGHAQHHPARILEKSLHSHRVDSIEYCHVGDRFLTGSRDGTGRIWQCNAKNEWSTVLLNSAQSLNM